MRISVSLAVLCIFARLLAETSWIKKHYHSLKDGNQLYSSCQKYQEHVSGSGDSMQLTAGAGFDIFQAGGCWGYIAGVVDGIPSEEGFNPDEKVRLSQYIDVVFAYLRDHPQQRHLQAYVLARTALSEAFPPRASR